jgi:Tfp pilus assembly protein PilF
MNRKKLPIALAAGLLVGCRSHDPVGPYSPSAAENRDESRAQKLTVDAVACADVDPAKAESLLRQALTADLFHGPAHNDLGVLFFREGKLYEAATEFEWARKLMPGHPDPRLNLALVLDRAGQTHDALAAYESALEAAPEHVPTMQAYARLAVREGRHDEKTTGMVKTIALRGETDAWRDWAAREMARVRTE